MCTSNSYTRTSFDSPIIINIIDSKCILFCLLSLSLSRRLFNKPLNSFLSSILRRRRRLLSLSSLVHSRLYILGSFHLKWLEVDEEEDDEVENDHLFWVRKIAYNTTPPVEQTTYSKETSKHAWDGTTSTVIYIYIYERTYYRHIAA